jgi:hypothetical protein
MQKEVPSGFPTVFYPLTYFLLEMASNVPHKCFYQSLPVTNNNTCHDTNGAVGIKKTYHPSQVQVWLMGSFWSVLVAAQVETSEPPQTNQGDPL